MLASLLGLSPVILAVLLILIGFSVVSWSILITKVFHLRTVARQSKLFLDSFWEIKDFQAIDQRLAEGLSPNRPLSPLARIFREGFHETQHFLETGEPVGRSPHLTADASAIDNISRTLRKVSAVEIEKLEKSTSFLATTASSTPFIGLFGTVWGIMNAFQSIGQAGSTSLAIVAPGISEALVTTAIGLAVAIPAVIGYNYLQSQLRKTISTIDNFSYDFLNIVQRSLNARFPGV